PFAVKAALPDIVALIDSSEALALRICDPPFYEDRLLSLELLRHGDKAVDAIARQAGGCCDRDAPGHQLPLDGVPQRWSSVTRSASYWSHKNRQLGFVGGRNEMVFGAGGSDAGHCHRTTDERNQTNQRPHAPLPACTPDQQTTVQCLMAFTSPSPWPPIGW